MGGNIGILYPVVEVVFDGQSMHQWVDAKIKHSHATIAEKSAAADVLRRQSAAAADRERSRLEASIDGLERDVSAEQKALRSFEFAKPYIDAYLPASPFQTLALITGLLLLGTIVKGVFLIADNVLVARLAQLATFDLRKLFYRRTLQMDLATFSEDGTADLMSRFTNDMNIVAAGLESLFGRLVVEPLKMCSCLVMAGFICWRLLLLSLVIAPVAAISVRWLARALKRANRRAMEEMAVMYTNLEETFRSIKIVKAFTNERRNANSSTTTTNAIARRPCASPATIRSVIR